MSSSESKEEKESDSSWEHIKSDDKFSNKKAINRTIVQVNKVSTEASLISKDSSSTSDRLFDALLASNNVLTNDKTVISSNVNYDRDEVNKFKRSTNKPKKYISNRSLMFITEQELKSKLREKFNIEKTNKVSENESSSTSEPWRFVSPRFDPGDYVPPKHIHTKKVTKRPQPSKIAPKFKSTTTELVGYKTFLLSLSNSVPMNNAHPNAKKYRLDYKNNKEELCKKLYELYNEKVFDNKLPRDMSIEWNVCMGRTAGYFYNKESFKMSGNVKSSGIVLATNILDTPDRLRDTLIHKMCHAASWIIGDIHDDHRRPFWTKWANKAMKTFPELPPIRRCHNYEIKTEYTYKCSGCEYSFGRHSKSVDIEKKRCENLEERKLSFSHDESSSTSEFDAGDYVPPKHVHTKEVTKRPQPFKIAPNFESTTTKPVGNKTFLSSLSNSVPMNNAHPNAKKYRLDYKNNKEELCKTLYELYNEKVFDNKLPRDMSIEWNVCMGGISYAGYFYNKKSFKMSGNVKSSGIVLATNILDMPDRLRDTLIHEMCHAASWIIDDIHDDHNDHHGPFWTKWANKAMKTFPELPPIRRCQNYEIKTKFMYQCTGCLYSFGRHSKSVDIEKKRCENLQGRKLSFSHDESFSTSGFGAGDYVPPKHVHTKKVTKRPQPSKIAPKFESTMTKPVGNKTFLSSLSNSVPMNNTHLNAKKYRLDYKNNKEELCKKLYELYNEKVFDNKLPRDISIEWNVRMRGTAGCFYKESVIMSDGNVVKSSRIVLATKILDTPDRLRDILIHEMCHVATWIIDDISDDHGLFWTKWTNKAMKIFPELPPIRAENTRECTRNANKAISN